MTRKPNQHEFLKIHQKSSIREKYHLIIKRSLNLKQFKMVSSKYLKETHRDSFYLAFKTVPCNNLYDNEHIVLGDM